DKGFISFLTFHVAYSAGILHYRLVDNVDLASLDNIHESCCKELKLKINSKSLYFDIYFKS
ncbi:MAG: hypothetical protein ACTSUL_03945, partial [Promethearchaeota archaeon]